MSEVPAIVVTKEIDIDKNDIANIAVAEVENKIRKNIKALKKSLDTTEKAIAAAQGAFEDYSAKYTTRLGNRAAKKFTRIKTAFKLSGFKEVKIDVSVSYNTTPTTLLDDYEYRKKSNCYQVALMTDEGSLKLKSQFLSVTKEQVKLAKDCLDLAKKKQEIIDESLKWRRKMADLPSIERQFKAKIARETMGKTKEGKAIINSLLKNLDADIKMLGV